MSGLEPNESHVKKEPHWIGLLSKYRWGISRRKNAMGEIEMQREIFESKCYLVGVSDVKRITGEEEACIWY